MSTSGAIDKRGSKLLTERATGEIDFFENVFDSICARETRINPVITKEALKGILLELAQHSRIKGDDNERISSLEINKAFSNVTTYAPIDESAVMLQRLPYLGRVDSGSSDRIFVDPYAKDGLRGLAEAGAYAQSDRKVAQSNWLKPLGDFGIRVLGSRITAGATAEKYVRFCISHGNQQVACDYVALKISQETNQCDFRGLSITSGKILSLNLMEREFKNLHLSSIEIENLYLESSKFLNFTLSDCIISSIEGIGSADKLPDIFQKCIIGRFDTALTISRISELNVSNQHKTLLALIKKLFFQPGSGRQEEALLRGAESYWDAAAARNVLTYMQRHVLTKKIRGDHGFVLIPMRRHTRRMAQIWELQSNCDDELWLMLNNS